MVTFVCQSSYCRPNATASLRFSKSHQRDITFTTPIIQSYINISDFWQTSASFEINLNRSMNDWNVSCIATNDQETYVTSRNVYLNIQCKYDSRREKTQQVLNHYREQTCNMNVIIVQAYGFKKSSQIGILVIKIMFTRNIFLNV